jgi:hypothetical protein
MPRLVPIFHSGSVPSLMLKGKHAQNFIVGFSNFFGIIQ